MASCWQRQQPCCRYYCCGAQGKDGRRDDCGRSRQEDDLATRTKEQVASTADEAEAGVSLARRENVGEGG